MTYFKFDIPKGLGYPKGWFGEMTYPPKNVDVLLYNEKEHYGIACTDDKAIEGNIKRKQCVEVEEAEALGTVTTFALRGKQADIYYGVNLFDKWKVEPEPEIEHTFNNCALAGHAEYCYLKLCAECPEFKAVNDGR
jgi:hypothetical protein